MTDIKRHLSHPKYRPDVDGLRAVAVLAVVAFHAFPNSVRGGFIGVDVFFVISGYLISSILFENLDRGSFSFAEFYSRRIRRIFPALILVLVACFAFGWVALLADEYKQLGKYIAAGAGFVSNLVLWEDAGYFDNSAETKPLLHLWSLGIEEQFYIVWPLLLWLAWKRKFNLLTITILVAVISFALNLKGVKEDAVATFYSPQTRFWELLVGSILAWFSLYKKGAYQSVRLKVDRWLAVVIYRGKAENNGATLANILSITGLALLTYGFWRINKDTEFPGRWAIIPVAGSVLIITAGAKTWINRHILSNRIAIWFGLISFPLYLWHWPLLSFARIVDGETPSREIRLGLVLLSILLSWGTYRLIERHIRLGGRNRVKINLLVVAMIAVGYLGFNTFERNGLGFRFPKIIQDLTQLQYDYKDAYREGSCFLRPEQDHTQFHGCTSAQRDIESLLLWGDSHAAHLYPGIKSRFEDAYQITQLTASGCPPILDLEIASRPHCKRINERVFEFIRTNKPDAIVLAAIWPSYDFTLLKNTIGQIKSAGVKHVYIIGPVPQWQDGLPKQLYLYFSNSFPHIVPTRMSQGLLHNVDQPEIDLRKMDDNINTHYVSSINILCNEKGCLTRLGDTAQTLTAWDYGHLTSAGSIYLVSNFPKM